MAINVVIGKEYSWARVQAILPGKTIPVQGITEFTYSEKQDKEFIHAAGNLPVALGEGKRSFSGKIKILQSEFEAMVRAIAGNEAPTQLQPFNLTFAYAGEDNIVVVDQCVYCVFTEWQKGMKAGDTHQEIEMPFICAQIKLNI